MMMNNYSYSATYQGSSSKKKKNNLDRFIPHSVSKNLYSCFLEASKADASDKKCKYKDLLDQGMLKGGAVGKILRFTEDASDKENTCENIQKDPIRKGWKVPTHPYKILEAPLLRDDFYLNLVDWSDSKNIAVGLQSSLYVWSGCMSKVSKIYEADSPLDYICSVGFMKHSTRLAMGNTEGTVKVFDISKNKPIVELENLHSGRIGSIACTNNLICTGSRDGYVSIQDIRTENQIMRYKAHSQQICGLKVAHGNDMIATGGNDNKLVLFSLRKMDKMMVWGDHKAAVKAIGFNPHDPSIASGSGTLDRRIRIFSLQTFELQSEIDTGSQICNLMYSPISNELVTTHGYSLNQISLWRLGKNGQLTNTASLMGHRNRVLYLAGESQGGKIVTGAGDEELRLWRVFDQQQHSNAIDLR